MCIVYRIGLYYYHMLLFMFNENKNELYEWNVCVYFWFFVYENITTQKVIRLYRDAWFLYNNKLFFESANENCYYINPSNIRILI